MKRIGLLVASYGTPQTEADIAPYYTHIRGGQTPSPAEVQALRDKYESIGGLSPLHEHSTKQATALVKALSAAYPTIDWVLAEGYKHVAPFLEDAVHTLVEKQVDAIVAIVLTPFTSQFATDSYMERIRKAGEAAGVPVFAVMGWGQSPSAIAYWAETLRAHKKEGQRVLWTAHSVPERVIQSGDTYVESVRQFVAAIAATAGETDPTVAWQSAGPRGTWLSPTVPDVIEQWKSEGVSQVLLAPVGFVSNHLEISYDLDTQIRGLCTIFFMSYERLPMPNDDGRFIAGMKEAIDGIMPSVLNA